MAAIGWPPRKGQSLTIGGFIRDADGDLVADPVGLAGRISKDWAAEAATANTPAVTASGDKTFSLVLTSGEMDADTIAYYVSATGSSGAKEFAAFFYTRDVEDQIAFGTCTGGSSLTSIKTGSIDPASVVADQWNGRILIFRRDAITAALRGQATDITDSTATGGLTVSALTSTPVNGDIFIIV